MTVEELNIKISADAENFKVAVAETNKTIENLKVRAVSAGKEITAAFDGLFVTDITAQSSEPENNSRPFGIFGDPGGRIARSSGAADIFQGGDQITAAQIFAGYNAGSTYSGTVNVPALDRNETVIGTLGSGAENDSTPIEITTTVELDGDKIGESVERYFSGRNRITNGREN